MYMKGRCQNLSYNNFCEYRMTGSIVALFVEWKVYERACMRSSELVIHIFLSALILNSKSCILSY